MILVKVVDVEVVEAEEVGIIIIIHIRQRVKYLLKR